MTSQYGAVLSQLLERVKYDFEPTREEVHARKEVCERLQMYIRRVYKKAQLSLFGSSCNGFGFSNSDLDICMVFSDVSDVIILLFTHVTSLLSHDHFFSGAA